MAERTLMLVHALAPPTPGGTPIILQRLLSGLGLRIEVVTDRALRGRVAQGGELVLDARYRWFGRLSRPRLPAPLRHLADALDLLLAAPLAGLRAARAARAAGADWVVVPIDGGFSQIAGLIAARLARRPLVLIVFDLWAENAYRPAEHLAARLLERSLFRAAESVVVWCDEAADHLCSKHGVRADVLPIPIDIPRDAPGGEVNGDEILVAGAVYWAQEDAARRLLRAARTTHVGVTMLGDEAELRRRGFEPDRVEAPLAGEAFRSRAARAGVLFVGLSFGSPHPDIVRTATPARFAEYLASERPVLVHAPAGAHVVEYAREHDLAEAVDEPDEERLAAALERLTADRDRARELVGNAGRAARERHDAGLVRRRFAEILEGLRS